ncbi:tRNA threonylcarbamoyl adenosine modification protein YeaZ [Leucobacter exalbidus]|uniref:tRNA threonylcarbamoyl adenosine modification protein YeaZ n=1 Tax=Leucobacter exalbidus TaxID=662960 RepID=A0A940PTR7_9MICO|nr:tRNA (adenosine(37)-N6)-threonylcarbamoyltransferase complex dimerization subunit type 1 TsaB [Leucobacter exalbidus]MBP1327334.1 tRNA threonylcarbamoyl adenosine modification protein YeaZ [Leucobacter exalbidus]
MTTQLAHTQVMTTVGQAPELGERCLLAIDTSIGTSVALGCNGTVWAVASENPRGHAEAIGTLLAQVFADSGVAASRVDGVIAGMGPGPFTGLRVGIAAAQAFAAGRNAPVYGLQSHEAVALAALELGAAAEVRVVTDARRKELFLTDYRALSWAGIPEVAAGPSLMPREGYEAVPGEMWPTTIDAAGLVRLAARRLAAGITFAGDQALYLREPDVAKPGPQKRVSA